MTQLKCDDYTSETFVIPMVTLSDDPLSMLLYLFYNADLLEIPVSCNEAALGYVDDVVNSVLLPSKALNCLPGCCTRLFSCSGILD
jgi:hypothetical protein